MGARNTRTPPHPSTLSRRCLLVTQTVIQPPLLGKLVMSPHLRHNPLIHHQNPVRTLHRPQPVRNTENRNPPKVMHQIIANLPLRIVI